MPEQLSLQFAGPACRVCGRSFDHLGDDYPIEPDLCSACAFGGEDSRRFKEERAEYLKN